MLDITDQKITVTNAISATDAKLLADTTTGIVTATIATTARVSDLKLLPAENNAFTIVISADDATN